ncbi:ABC transporter permease [Pelagibacterium sp.]|uniref:ABC transporter permease n=1 Tax=Pelagibacterium sp. TaxID=1967288 RepID=UPI003BA9644B
MLRYLITRTASSAIVIMVVAVIVFILALISGGDPATIYAGEDASPERLDAIRERMGLNQPTHVQFLVWFWHILQGDFGTSLFTDLPVLTLVAQRVEPTVVLSLGTIIFSVAVAIPIGTAAALNPGKKLDKALSAFTNLAFALPGFIAAYILIYIFAVQLRWLPVQGYSPLSEGLGSTIRSVILPCATLSLIYVGLIARTTRASMLAVLQEDYIRSARARGASTFRVVVSHAMRNATNSITTVIGLGIASLLSGVTITETVFAIPGLGRLTVDAVLNRDFPIVQGLILLFAAVKITINLMIDLSYRLVDPRIEV